MKILPCNDGVLPSALNYNDTGRAQNVYILLRALVISVILTVFANPLSMTIASNIKFKAL